MHSVALYATHGYALIWDTGMKGCMMALTGKWARHE